MKQPLRKAGLAALLASSLVTYAADGIRRNVPSYVERNLPQIIESQEKELDIRHLKWPKIEFSYEHGDDILGAHSNGTIWLYLRPMVTPENNVWDKIKNAINKDKTFDVRSILDHELGHLYYDTTLRKTLGQDYSVLCGGFTHIIGDRFVSEGIAEYFETRMGVKHEGDKFALRSDFEKNEAYQFVKPIIDKYGEKGIKYLVEHPFLSPHCEDPIYLSKYQKAAMEQLSQESKNSSTLQDASDSDLQATS